MWKGTSWTKLYYSQSQFRQSPKLLVKVIVGPNRFAHLLLFWLFNVRWLYLTLFFAYVPPYHILLIFSGRIYPRRLQVYSNFKFCNCRTYKIGPRSKNFSYGTWEPVKVGWVAHFLLHFCLEIDYNFTFTKSRWNFLVEIES